MYQHGLKTSSWIASSKNIEASVNTSERPRSISVKSGKKNQVSEVPFALLKQDSHSVGAGQRKSILSGTDELGDVVIVKD